MDKTKQKTQDNFKEWLLRFGDDVKQPVVVSFLVADGKISFYNAMAQGRLIEDAEEDGEVDSLEIDTEAIAPQLQDRPNYLG